jgi:hypothetical protein
MLLLCSSDTQLARLCQQQQQQWCCKVNGVNASHECSEACSSSGLTKRVVPAVILLLSCRGNGWSSSAKGRR